VDSLLISFGDIFFFQREVQSSHLLRRLVARVFTTLLDYKSVAYSDGSKVENSSGSKRAVRDNRLGYNSKRLTSSRQKARAMN